MQQQQQQAAGSYRGFGHDSTPNTTDGASSSPYRAVARPQAMHERVDASRARPRSEDYAPESTSSRGRSYEPNTSESSYENNSRYPDRWAEARSREPYPTPRESTDSDRISTAASARAEQDSQVRRELSSE